MKPCDTIGKEFMVGQLVHVPCQGTYKAIVTEVMEGHSSVVASPHPPRPPMVRLQITLDVACNISDGKAAAAYIVIDPPKDIESQGRA